MILKLLFFLFTLPVIKQKKSYSCMKIIMQTYMPR